MLKYFKKSLKLITSIFILVLLFIISTEPNLLIKKNQPLEIGGTHIFFRAGPKEINDLRIIVTNQFKDKAIFKVSPFTFRVKNPTNHHF